MKALLAKLLGMFHRPEPQKSVDPWPFPAIKATKKKPAVKKATTRKPAVKKPAVKKAKK